MMVSFNSYVDILVDISTNVSKDLLLADQNHFTILNFLLFEWTLKNQGALVVLMDMSLAIASIVFNLMVITSVQEKEACLEKHSTLC
jgi:hypothetical protein